MMILVEQEHAIGKQKQRKEKSPNVSLPLRTHDNTVVVPIMPR